MRIIVSIIFVALFAVFSVGETPIGIQYTIQPHKSSLIVWSNGSCVTKDRASVVMPARGIEVLDTSSGGVLKVHLINDFDAAGRKVWTLYKIPASAGAIQRIGLIFDEIDSAGTTIPKAGIILWH